MLRLRLRFDLWVYELELIAVEQPQRRVRLGADTDPVDARGRQLRSVRLDGDLESARVKRVDQRFIELEQRLAAGANHERLPIGRRRPRRRNPGGEVMCACEPSSIRADADEVRIAELAHGAMTVIVASRPEIAAAEAAEHGGTAG